MSSHESVPDSIAVTAECIGGIDRTAVTLEPGVNVLTGRNATNRTSFLQAIMAAIGSDRPSLKGDADRGRVELVVDGAQYTRTLDRRDGTVSFGGDPYLEDPELADLFAFLLESNEARRAVRRGENLRDLIMRPIDTDEIEAEIATLEAEKRDLDERLDELADLETELPALEERRRAIEADVDAKRDRLATRRETVEGFEPDLEANHDRREEIEETFADLQDARADLDSIEYDLETERESKAELESERDDLEAELDAHGDDLDSSERLEGRMQELRERKRSLDTTLNELQSVIRFNESRLEEDGIDVELDPASPADRSGEPTSDGSGTGAVTDRLLEDDSEVVCWTCGSPVERERIESILEELRSLHREKLTERNELQDRIDELSERKREIEQQAERRRELERRLSSIEDELDRRRERIATLEERRRERQARIETLEAETDTLETAEYEEVIDAHRAITQLEMELDALEDERETVRDRIDGIETKLEERDSLERRRNEIDDELTDLRTRVERIEERAVEAFNDHMESILSILEYGNVERIWIERRERSVREGRSKATTTAFDLHVVRTADDGTTYEDRIDHLSESEREVTGLIFALAGLLVHDVHETVPFVLLDSLEAIDAERIADLVAYFEEYVDCLVVALLHEDAEVLPDSYSYVTEI